jgi:hypothetical protein
MPRGAHLGRSRRIEARRVQTKEYQMPTDRPGRNGSPNRNRGGRRATAADEVLGSGFGESTLDSGSDEGFSAEPLSDVKGTGSSRDTSVLSGEGDTLKDKALKSANGFVQQARQQAVSQINAQKDRAAEGLGSVAQAIRQAGDQLKGQNEVVASYVDTAVGQIEQFSLRLREKEPQEFVRDLEEFARRSPSTFLGAAFILGVGLARFLRSSGDPRRNVDDGTGSLPRRGDQVQRGGDQLSEWQRP